MATSLRGSPSGLIRWIVTMLLAVLLIGPQSSMVSALHSTDTITSGGDNTRSGYQPNHNMDPAVVASPQFGILWRKKLLGNYRGFNEQVYAQPLVYTPTNKQYLYVSTQMNWVYKLDAVTGDIVASRNLHIPFLVSDLDGCNDISDCIGNTATGVIDPATNTWYLTTKTYRDQSDVEKGRLNGRYYIHALDCDTLEERPNFPINLEGTVATNNPIRVFQGWNHHQRPALIQTGPYIYAGFASHCVQYNFTGWVIGWHVTEGRIVEAFATEGGPEFGPDVKGGGVWMSGGGISSDNNKRLLFGTGNGYASQLHGTPVPGRQPPSALEEAAVNMAINADGTLSVVDFFMPFEKEQLDGADKDLGTSPLVLFDPKTFTSPKVPRLGAITGKSGKTYFLNIDDLGGYQMGTNKGDAVPQVTQNQNSVFSGAGSYPLEGGFVYVNVVQYPTQVFKFSVSPDGSPVFTKVAETKETAAFILGVSHGTTTSLNDQPGTGLYWISDIQGYNLRIYKAVPINGFLESVKLMNIPGAMKFSRPVFGNGRAYLTTSTGEVVGVGSPTNTPFTCSSPYDFGDVIVGQTSATKTISCKANINTQVNSIGLSSPANFALQSIPNLPLNVAAGQNLTFQATFSPSGPGSLSDDIYVNTTNAVVGYSINTAIAIKGQGKSLNPVLAVNPNTVSFNPVIVGENPNGVDASFIISNLGQGTLTISSYDFSSTSENGPFVQPTVAANGDKSVGSFTFKSLPTTIPGNTQVTVTINFNPQTVGNFVVYLNTNSNGGSKKLTIAGTAGGYPKALLEFEKADGSGWVVYDNTTAFDFGSVYQSTTTNLKMRLSNVGGPNAGRLDISVSKPPIGAGQIVGARNSIDLGEGTTIAPGESKSAVLFCSVPKAQVNTNSYDATATWTMNTGDPSFGHQVIRFHCKAIAEQVGPLRPDSSGQYRYVGCYKENNPGRQLTTQLYGSDTNTNGQCQTDCKNAPQNWVFVGTQYHRECWCGSKIPTLKIEDIHCNFDCSGNSSQTCGGNGLNNDGSFISLFADANRFNPNDTNANPSTTAAGPVTPTTTPAGPSHPTLISPNFKYQGCYTEATAGRALTGKTVNAPDMNLNYCAGNCTGFTYFGVEYGEECYCGNAFSPGSAPAANQGDCNFLCPGDPSQYCGAGNRLDLYKAGAAAPTTAAPAAGVVTPSSTPTGPAIKPTVGDYTFQGCYTEATGTRALSAKTLVAPDMALKKCAATCTGYTFFGVEYGTECYCGNSLAAGSALAANQADCSFLCPGNQFEYCGAGDRLEMYKLTSATTTTADTAIPVTTTNPVSQSTPTGPSHPAYIAPNFTYQGCYTEATNGRALSAKVLNAPDMTLDKCSATCAGFTYFGVEYGTECYCGSSLAAGSVLAANQGDCKFLCPGNNAQFCGAGVRLDLYKVDIPSSASVAQPAAVATTTTAPADIASNNVAVVTTSAADVITTTDVAVPANPVATTTAAPVVTTSTTSAPPSHPSTIAPNFAYQGCYTEATTGRALSAKTIATDTMTLELCASTCAGYTYFGVEYGRECYCGNSLAAGSVPAANQADCKFPCPEDGSELCGAGLKLDLYMAGGVAPTTAAAVVATTAAAVAMPTPTGPAIKLTVGAYTYQGCLAEATTGRALSAKKLATDTMTLELCAQTCAGYTYFGVEYARECYCGNTLAAGSANLTEARQGECKMVCKGDPGEFCGAGSRLSMFKLTATIARRWRGRMHI